MSVANRARLQHLKGDLDAAVLDCNEAIRRDPSHVDGYVHRALARMDLRAGLSRVAAATLVVVGAQDPSTPPEHGEAVAAAIPGARLERLDPSAHMAAIERAGDVTRLLLEHLAPAA